MTKPLKLEFVPRGAKRRQLGLAIKQRATLSMDPHDWAIMTRLAKPEPWRGNLSRWLRDHLRGLSHKHMAKDPLVQGPLKLYRRLRKHASRRLRNGKAKAA